MKGGADQLGLEGTGKGRSRVGVNPSERRGEDPRR
jgi:hypothetical protein